MQCINNTKIIDQENLKNADISNNFQILIRCAIKFLNSSFLNMKTVNQEFLTAMIHIC